jgi:hypothetical protein
LKKRSKKLLPIASGVSLDTETPVLAGTDKSFLVLFFKKDLLSLSSFFPPFRNWAFYARPFGPQIGSQAARSCLV